MSWSTESTKLDGNGESVDDAVRAAEYYQTASVQLAGLVTVGGSKDI